MRWTESGPMRPGGDAMQQDLWFELAVRGEPNFASDVLRRFELGEPTGPTADPTPDAAPDAGAEAKPEPVLSDDLFC